MANEIEHNTEEVVKPTEEAPQEEQQEEEETPDWEAKAKELEAEATKYKRMAEQRAKKLEDLKNNLEDKPKEKAPQQQEPDYAKLAFLNSQNVIDADDQKMVLNEANRLKLPLTDVLAMEHVKTNLKANADQRESQANTPKGSGRSGKATPADVDYYLEHPDEVPPSQELHEKVIEAKMNKIKNDSKFSDVPFIG